MYSIVHKKGATLVRNPQPAFEKAALLREQTFDVPKNAHFGALRDPIHVRNRHRGDVLQSIVRCASSVQMGRGLASKGKRVEGSAPEWLNPIKEGEGGGGGGFGGGSSVRQVEEEKPRKRRGGDNDDLDEPVKKGIQWKPLAFLVLMVLPGLAPVLINVADRWVHA